ncbi:MAG TPA: hypothetical protein VFE16_01270 [Candidatus Cybelea sp.]|jgi:hypothetical protein|nr:hypothetical protein [Candidatus Cybelea sp.]
MALRRKDQIRTAARQAGAQRRVGEDAACPCGEKRPEALIAGRTPTVCYECDAKRRSKSTLEEHHVAGRANDPTAIDVPINDHRAELSVAQYEWPPLTLQNPEGSPLLAIAARIRGFVNTLLYLIGKLLEPIPGDLEAYDAQLRERLGPQWWLSVRNDEPPNE